MSLANNETGKRNGVEADYHEDLGSNTISHVKSTGGMTISPELFEKVFPPLTGQSAIPNAYFVNKRGTALLDSKNN